MFATSKQLGRIPVLAVTGLSGSGKTTFLNRLLQLPELARTVVLTTTGENQVVFSHQRVLFLPATDFVSESGCLCCDMRSALGDTLRSLFLQALSKRIPPIDRLVIETPALDPAQLKFTLRHAPFLGQRYVYHATLFVLDAAQAVKAGLSQKEKEALALADQIVFAKNDLVDAEQLEQLKEQITVLKPGARIILSDEAVLALSHTI